MPRYPEILEVIKAVRAQVRWKPNSAEYHLKKRKRRGHLPQTATLEDYEGIILKILHCRINTLWSTAIGTTVYPMLL